MKDLKDLKKPYKVLFSLILPISLYSNEIISTKKIDIIENSKNKVEASANKLSNDWLNSVKLKYIDTKDQTSHTQYFNFSLDQPIFKSGGIFYAIEYANINKSKNSITIDREKLELEKSIYKIVLNLRKNQFLIDKQKILIANSNIDIERKQEQVMQGLIDVSFLDNAILTKNAQQNALIDLEIQKLTLLNSLKSISNREYTQISLPSLNLSKDEFLESHLGIKLQKSIISENRTLVDLTNAKYMPTLNVVLNYSKYLKNDSIFSSMSDTKDRSYNYGFNITMPFSVNSRYEKEISTLEALNSELELNDMQNQELLLFETKKKIVDKIDKKISLAKEDLKLYDSLISQLKELYRAGLKTDLDIKTMKNSKNTKLIDINIFKIDKDIEMLEVYY